jgi:cytochrome c-type biogenesis protein CcmF
LTTAIFFFTLLMIVATNPFKTFNHTPLDGKGLNHLLQNPGKIFHPPTFFSISADFPEHRA